MKTFSILLFVLILIFVIQSDIRQNSVWAQSKPVCAYCGADELNGEAHKLYKGSKCPQDNNTKSKSNNSGNVDYRLTLIQGLLNALFSDESTDNAEKQRQLEEHQKELRKIEVENEKQRLLKEKLDQEIHNNLMALTKKLPDSKNLEMKDLLKDSFEGKSFDGDNKDLGFKEIDISKNEELPIKTDEDVNKDFFGEKVIDEKDFKNSEKVNSLVKQEQIKYDNNFNDWVKDNNGDILLRLKESDPYLADIVTSIKTKAPPPLDPYSEPGTKVKDLQPGDVLLVGNNYAHPITILDKLFSGTLKTNASHTLLYLKEIAGQKMFLDMQPGLGERIITETQFYVEYGYRPMEVASLIGKPTNYDNGDKLYNAAFELVGENEQYKYENPWGIFTGSKYGLEGEDMVCSEADKWVLRKANFFFPNTEDKIKRIFGLDFSPADYSKSGYFCIRPLKLNTAEDY